MCVIETLRLRSDHGGFGERVFRVRSGEALVGHAENFVANFELLHAGTYGIDHAGEVGAQN